MQHLTMDDISSNHSDWSKISAVILSKKLFKYNVGEVQEKKITIEFEYEDNNNFSREFICVDNNTLMENISNQEIINLKYCYIKDFDYGKVKNKKPFKKFMADFAFFDGATSFHSARFNAEASFCCATFGAKTSFENAIFDADATFKAAAFCDESSFAMTAFRAKALFGAATFNNEASFKATIFSDEALFGMAIFNNEASFVVATFDAKASFERTTFIAEVSFYNSKFKKDVSFERATLCDEVSFKAVNFSEEASFDYAAFNAESSFDNTTFCAKASFYNTAFGGQTSFAEATFDAAAAFYNTTFGNPVSFFSVIFNNEALFGRTTFNSDASFYSAKFKNATSFKSAKFNANASFIDTKFENDVSFEAAAFNCDVNFGKAAFNNKTSFEETSFGVTTSFEETKFSEQALFKYVNFKGETVFYGTKFINGVNFNNCIADSIIFRKYIFQNDNEFEFEIINKLVFDNCIIKSTFNLENYTDYAVSPSIERPVKIGKLSFKNTQNLGRINIDWEKNKVEDAVLDNGDTFEEKKEQFAMLKENYHSIGDYSSEDKAFVSYMRCRRETLSNWFTKKLDNLIEIIGKYGTKPSRIVLVMIIVWLFFSLLFSVYAHFNGLLANDNPVSFLNGFYFSAVTFFTIGYGDIVPACLATKIMAPVEGALGLFLMSYFTVAVVRKTLR